VGESHVNRAQRARRRRGRAEASAAGDPLVERARTADSGISTKPDRDRESRRIAVKASWPEEARELSGRRVRNRARPTAGQVRRAGPGQRRGPELAVGERESLV